MKDQRIYVLYHSVIEQQVIGKDNKAKNKKVLFNEEFCLPNEQALEDVLNTHPATKLQYIDLTKALNSIEERDIFMLGLNNAGYFLIGEPIIDVIEKHGNKIIESINNYDSDVNSGLIIDKKESIISLDAYKRSKRILDTEKDIDMELDVEADSHFAEHNLEKSL